MKIILVICLISSIFSAVEFDLEQIRNDLLDRHNYYRESPSIPSSPVSIPYVPTPPPTRIPEIDPNPITKEILPRPEIPPLPKPETPTPPPNQLPEIPGFIYAPDQAPLQDPYPITKEIFPRPEKPPLPKPEPPKLP